MERRGDGAAKPTPPPFDNLRQTFDPENLVEWSDAEFGRLMALLDCETLDRHEHLLLHFRFFEAVSTFNASARERGFTCRMLAFWDGDEDDRDQEGYRWHVDEPKSVMPENGETCGCVSTYIASVGDNCNCLQALNDPEEYLKWYVAAEIKEKLLREREEAVECGQEAVEPEAEKNQQYSPTSPSYCPQHLFDSPSH